MPASNARSRRPSRARPAARTLDGAPNPSPQTERRLVLAVGALALALGLGLLFMILGPHRIGDYMAETDFYGAYAEGARLVQHGHLIPSRYGVVGPGYEVLLALVGFVVPNLFVAAELISLIATVLTVLLWFALLRRRADARVAFAAAALLAVNTFLFRYGYSATTDAASIAWQALALFLLLGRAGTRARLGAGLAAAVAFLTRYNAIYLVPAGLLAIVAGGTLASEGDPAPGARRGREALFFSVGFLAPVVPWVLFSLAHGSGFSFQLHHNIAYEVFARSKGIPWDDYQKYMQPQFHSLWDVIARDPRAVAARMVINVGEHLRDDALKLMGWPTALAAAAGLMLALFDKRARSLWPVLVSAALLFLTLVPAFYSERYSLALMPMYTALGGLAFGSPRLAFPAGRLWLKALLILLPLALALDANVKSQAYNMSQLPVEILDAAATLRELKRPGDKVIARKPHIAFHAGVEAVPFPFADSLSQLASGARRLGARWMYFSWPEAETRPAFWFMLDTAATVPGLTVRRVTSPHPAVLYEIGPDFGRTPAWFSNDTLRAWHTLRARTLVDASSSQLLASRGAVERLLGKYEDARHSLQAALVGNPNNLAVLLELGAVGYQLNDAALSVGALERAIQLHPEDADAHLGLGWAYDLAGREPEAAAVWAPVVSNARDVATLRRMREVFESTGNHEAAARATRALAGMGSGR